MTPSQFYATICKCQNTIAQCPGVVNSHATGWPPRGFFTEVQYAPVPLLAVCKNPGHLLPGEADLYQSTSADDLAKVHMDYAAVTFKGGNAFTVEARRSTTFHKNLIRYISFILDVDPIEAFTHFAYTNLVKCSGIGEQDTLDPKTMNECFSKHFLREIAYFQPKVLLAFGREVETFLLGMRRRGIHALPIIYMKHPSYFYRRDLEANELARIKLSVRNFTDA